MSINDTKIDWDHYYLTIAREISKRSIDPATKHGCVIVDECKRVLSVGYNGPIAGINDDLVPLTRPEKYYWMLHAEQNAILFCNASMQNSTVYITGRPCSICVRMLLQKGVREIICGKLLALCIDEVDRKHGDAQLAAKGVVLRELDF